MLIKLATFRFTSTRLSNSYRHAGLSLQLISPQFLILTDIYTKITWQKVSVPGHPIIQTDSLICTKNGTNTYTINY